MFNHAVRFQVIRGCFHPVGIEVFGQLSENCLFQIHCKYKALATIEVHWSGRGTASGHLVSLPIMLSNVASPETVGALLYRCVYGRIVCLIHRKILRRWGCDDAPWGFSQLALLNSLSDILPHARPNTLLRKQANFGSNGGVRQIVKHGDGIGCDGYRCPIAAVPAEGITTALFQKRVFALSLSIFFTKL